MTRFRMIPTAAQEAALLGHCAHARFMWNLALEQWAMWSPTRRGYPPGYVGQARQLTDARAEDAWLRLGSQTVQQQALRDFARAQRGSRRRSKIKSAIARMRAKEADRRRNWGEQTTTDLARRFDTIRIEDLRITQMTRTARGTAEKPGRNVRAKAGLNRAIRRQGWGLLARRL
ncbi:MAG TPA: helix-turn-helix domain-containing protein, partial [Kribbella sp.]